jgi:hypothetical protein
MPVIHRASSLARKTAAHPTSHPECSAAKPNSAGVRFTGHVGRNDNAAAPFRLDLLLQRTGAFLRPINQHNGGPLARKQDCHGAAVPHARAARGGSGNNSHEEGRSYCLDKQYRTGRFLQTSVLSRVVLRNASEAETWKFAAINELTLSRA